MPRVMIDAAFRQRDDYFQLREMMDEPLADVYVFRLHAALMLADNQEGVARLTPARLGEHTGCPDPQRLLNALIVCGFLQPRPDVGEGFYYISEWDQNATFFTKRNYQRRYRARQKAAEAPAVEETGSAAPAPAPETGSDTRSARVSLRVSPSVPLPLPYHVDVDVDVDGRANEKEAPPPPPQAEPAPGLTVLEGTRLAGSLSASEVESVLTNEYGLNGAISARWVPQLSAACRAGKVTRQALDYAYHRMSEQKAREGGRRNAGLLMSILFGELTAAERWAAQEAQEAQEAQAPALTPRRVGRGRPPTGRMTVMQQVTANALNLAEFVLADDAARQAAAGGGR